MRALLWRAYGSADGLIHGEAPAPEPQAGQVKIRVRAVGLNAADLHLLEADPFPVRLYTGLFRPRFLTLGADVAGTVEAVGPGASRFRPGDPVWGDLSGSGWGGLAEWVCAPEAVLAPLPPGLGFDQAAALPMAGVTALQALRDHGKIRPGMRVLVHGASGGVGSYSVQLARAFGAEVTAVCSSAGATAARDLGAQRVLDYRQTDFSTEGPNYDLIHVANGDRRPADYLRALAPGGVAVVSGGSFRQLTRAMIQGPWLSRAGRSLVTMTARPQASDLEVLAGLVTEGRLRPVVDRTYPWAEAREAFRYLAGGHARGKVTVQGAD